MLCFGFLSEIRTCERNARHLGWDERKRKRNRKTATGNTTQSASTQRNERTNHAGVPQTQPITKKRDSRMNTRAVGEGFVRLDAVMANDYSVVNSARVSFAQQSSDLHNDLSGKDKGLISFLMKERHGTPFEHNAFRFHVKCPVFVAREWFRHRIGSYNEFSARYSEVPNEFFVPDESTIRTQVGKPGAYTFEPVDDALARSAVEMISEVNTKAYEIYSCLVDLGVAKEVARMVLPVSMYTQFYWTVNARSLMNFLSLRTDVNAQYEIREFADAVEVFFQEQMPVTWSAWVECGKVCP